jgi:hypothetical protein
MVTSQYRVRLLRSTHRDKRYSNRFECATVADRTDRVNGHVAYQHHNPAHNLIFIAAPQQSQTTKEL